MDVITIITIVVCSLLAIVWMAMLFCNFPKFANMEKATHVVAVGEDLWSIAERYCLKDEDILDYIDLLCRVNDIPSCTVSPGQTLTVYVHTDKKGV